MERLGIHRAAKRMYRLFGARATMLSDGRADELLELGKIERFSDWAQIADALRRLRPPSTQGAFTAGLTNPR